MPRRALVKKRKTIPDAKYSSMTVSRLINKIMIAARKAPPRLLSTAPGPDGKVRGQRPDLGSGTGVSNVTPLLQVKPRRVGGATYQVPVEVRPGRTPPWLSAG